MLKTGTKAPAFTLLDQHGKSVSLEQFAKRKVLVYFYPKADTPGCTQQTCLLRDISGEIGRTAIIGISPDSPTKQLKFADKFAVKFPLLAVGVLDRQGRSHPSRLVQDFAKRHRCETA